MNQREMSRVNGIGWNQGAYAAWVKRYGVPEEYAEILKGNPQRKVSHYTSYIGDVRGKKIAHLLGSKGNKAVCFALMGANVTVVDLSVENKVYAMALADHAGVTMDYIVCDLLEVPEKHPLNDFDVVLLELGVLHYFVDLKPVFTIVKDILKSGGMFVLRDYHPVASKLLKVEAGKMVAEGDYFDKGIVDLDVAFWNLLDERETEGYIQNKIRRWTLGEIVTSLVEAGLTIKRLDEESGVRWAFPHQAPPSIEHHIPGLYTITAVKE
ncbi:class I SAM-dependent methyltransferase [Bacillus sp. KH172YL63]|uniref:class I SAM-dependent methyltransferase n=1 Tax=Bacillus sp. KH172YL63 TaxID=2709784 RepID=UPI0013E4EFC0|nr:methyltransferase domain-containing protein [Bacillus sp. KH172YL63]BCB03711.1 methyltransferase [Bacillus sp. KH172YL63]